MGGKSPDGGVGRITFDSIGWVTEYKRVLTNTRRNCGAGSTPWGTFISCEEYNGQPANGQCWEVHPEEEWPARPTKMGGAQGGKFESAAFNHRDMTRLKGFVTTDSSKGSLHRFSPDDATPEKDRTTHRGKYDEAFSTR